MARHDPARPPWLVVAPLSLAVLLGTLTPAFGASPGPGAGPADPTLPPPPAPVALEADERLLLPAADVASRGVVAVPGAVGALFAALADGTSFAEADDADHVAAVAGPGPAVHRTALSHAPSGNVIGATVFLRASAAEVDTTLQVRLYDGPRLVAAGPTRPLLARWGWVDLAEDFPTTVVSSAADLHVEVALGGPDGAAGRYSQLWVRVHLKVSLAFGPTGVMGGGTYTGVAMSPETDSILVGSSRGGIARSADGGLTFSARNAALTDAPLQRIAAVVYHPARPGVAYAAAGTRGRDSAIFHSEDDGRHWTLLSGVPQFSAVPGPGELRDRPLAVGRLLEARDDARGVTWLWAATWEQGVMRSSDGGRTWQTMGLAGERLRGLVLDPAVPDRLYVAALGSGAWVTQDAWARSATFAPVPGSPRDVEELAFVGDRLFAAGGAGGLFRLDEGVFVPLDTGVRPGSATWTAVAGFEAGTVAVVLAGCAPCHAGPDGDAVSLIRSTDGGATWAPAAAASSVDVRPLGDTDAWPLAVSRPDLLPGGAAFATHQLAARGPADGAADGGTVLLAAEGAVWRSTDGGVTWRPAVRGLGGVGGQVVASDPRDPARVALGLEDLGAAFSVDGLGRARHESWSGGDGTILRGATAGSFAFDASTTPASVVVALSVASSGPSGAVLVSRDPLTGAPWLDTGFTAAFPELRPTAVAVGQDAQGTRVVLAATHPGGGLVRKVGEGPWLHVAPGEAAPFSDPQAPPRADVAWVLGTGLVYAFDPVRGLFRSTDAGLTWQLAWSQPSLKAGTGSLAVSPDGDVVFVATGTGVHRLDGASRGSVARGEVSVTQLGTFRRAADVHLDADGRLWVASPILAGSPARLAVSWEPFSDEPFFHDLATFVHVNSAVRPTSLTVLADGGVLLADATLGAWRGQPSAREVDPWFPDELRLLSLRQEVAPETSIEPLDERVARALADPFVVWVAADGDDARDGVTEADAVATLGRAQEVLRARFGEDAAGLDRDVLVNVLSGTYVGQRTRWTFSHPLHIVRIAGHPDGSKATKPRFIGCATPSCPSAQPWFQLDATRGEPSNLQLVNLSISTYHRPLVLLGGSDPETEWNGGNLLHRLHFFNVGTRYRSDITPEVWSPGIVILKNSRSNAVWHNRFEASSNRIEHTNAFFHVIYASRGASHNSVRFNEVIDTAGDFHLRDGSDGNVFADNRIVASFARALVTDWSGPGETESCGTRISANTWKGDWLCKLEPVDFSRESPSSDGRCGSSRLRDFVVETPNDHLPAAARCEPR